MRVRIWQLKYSGRAFATKASNIQFSAAAHAKKTATQLSVSQSVFTACPKVSLSMILRHQGNNSMHVSWLMGYRSHRPSRLQWLAYAEIRTSQLQWRDRSGLSPASILAPRLRENIEQSYFLIYLICFLTAILKKYTFAEQIIFPKTAYFFPLLLHIITNST